MSKLLFERNMFQKLLDLFFKAKSNGNEDRFISKIQYDDPELADAFEKLNNSMVKASLTAKSVLQKNGLDTSKIDDFLKKHYNKF
jgi:hypothetical protein